MPLHAVQAALKEHPQEMEFYLAGNTLTGNEAGKAFLFALGERLIPAEIFPRKDVVGGISCAAQGCNRPMRTASDTPDVTTYVIPAVR